MTYQLDPLTENARVFTRLYGSRFEVMGMGAGGLALQLRSLGTGRSVKVDKRPEGIYVNDIKFCDSWVDTK